MTFAGPTLQVDGMALTIDLQTGYSACSFAGGCELNIEAEGLSSALLADGNYIEVCGNKCALDTDLSSTGTTVCNLEPLVSTYSVAQYALATPAVL